MAYINLLPPEERKKIKDWRQKLLTFLIFSYILILSFLYINTQLTIKELRLEKVTLTQQIAIVEPGLKKIQELEKEQKALEARLQSGKNLDKATYYSQLLVITAQLMPGGVTLSRLNYDGQKLSYEGEALDYRNVADFMANLKKSDRFTDVELLSSFTTRNQELIGFKISVR